MVKDVPDPREVPPVVLRNHSIVAPVGAVAVSVTVPPEQVVNGPAPGVGAAGPGETVAVIFVLVSEAQPAFLDSA